MVPYLRFIIIFFFFFLSLQWRPMCSCFDSFFSTFAFDNRLLLGRRYFSTDRHTAIFSNGGDSVDYLAFRLGLTFEPGYPGQCGRIVEKIYAMNYASASAGIIFITGSELGQHISLTQQIQQVSDTFQQLIIGLGDEEETDLTSKSVFDPSIGSNDYIDYYVRNVSKVEVLYLPFGFNHLLLTTVKQGLKNLYNVNVRRMVVMELAPIGCVPRYLLWQYSSRDGECVKEINDTVMEFNFATRFMGEELIHKLPDYAITFCDTFDALVDIMKNRQQCVTSDACCGFGRYHGWFMCLPSDMAYSAASNVVGSVSS